MAAPAAAAVSTNTSQTNLVIPPQPKRQTPSPQPRQQPLKPQIQTALSPPPSHTTSIGSASAAISPHRTGITNWWKGFKSKTPFRKGEEPEIAPKGIFGVSLNTSIQYAYVNISITNASGNSEVYGRIPIIVAKCGVYLKDKATDVEGIFRVSGSAKRIKELQALFDSPPTYGKSLDWDGFNVHDAANVFRRYINHLPEPIIPYDYYFAFRKPLEHENPNAEDTIRTYQRLIGDLPKLNGQLLLYILDLLAVFAENSTQNLMPASNLAAIFQPGLLSHPDHDMHPQEYRVSQEVLVFLIQHQDRFLPNTAVRQDTPPQPLQPVEQRPIQQKVAPQPVEQRTIPKPLEHRAAPQPLNQRDAPQPSAPPAKYSGVYPPPDSPSQKGIPRRRTFTKKSETSPTIAGKVLRRNRTTRSPQSPRLAVEQEELRRVSEGSVPSTGPVRGEEETTTPLVATFSHRRKTLTPPPAPTPLNENENFEEGKEDVLSSPVIQSTQPIEAEPVQTTESTGVEESTVNMRTEEVPSESNHVTEMTQSTAVNNGTAIESGAISGILAVVSTPMGRSSSYREELDEVIDYGDQVTTTSTDNTETETSDADHQKYDSKKNKKNKRISKLLWSSSSEVSGEAKISTIFSVTSASGEDTGKPLKRLQKRRRPKVGDVQINATGIAFGVGQPGSLKSPGTENDRGGILSPPPWIQQNNVSQSSLKSSELCRHSHISSNRSSMEIPRSPTPVDRPVARPPSFAPIQQSHYMDDDLPTEVIMPAAQAEIPRKSSQSSNHSAASSGKGSKIGAWIRKKREFSVSSSTGAGGGISAVSD